jgi:hypothetical protein
MANRRQRGWPEPQPGGRNRHDDYGNPEGGFGYPGPQPGPGRPADAPASRGPHAGKGPKGYRRSDERIREDVGDVLERHPDIDASDIELQVSEGVVTLSGMVEDRRTKRLAEDVVDTVAGVKDVFNQLRISQGRLDDILGDFSASGTAAGRGATGDAGPAPEEDEGPPAPGRKREG